MDDDPIVLELLTLLLSEEVVEVASALGGQAAVDRLDSGELPDVVVVDHQMPEVSGSDVARAVRALPDPRPRILAMSASSLPADELALFDGYLRKPVNQDALHAALSDSQRTTSPAEAESPSLPSAIDANIVRKLSALMPPAALEELYRTYVTDTRQRITELEQYSASGDEDGLRRCAHAIKGAASMTGVSGIAAIAADLEAGRLPRPEHGRLFHELRAACDDVERSMTSSVVHGEAR